MVHVEVRADEGQTAEQAVDQDIERFDKFMLARVDDQPLTRFERAILKTYLRWKTHEDVAVQTAG
jgi:hypothetical protein